MDKANWNWALFPTALRTLPSLINKSFEEMMFLKKNCRRIIYRFVQGGKLFFSQDASLQSRWDNKLMSVPRLGNGVIFNYRVSSD